MAAPPSARGATSDLLLPGAQPPLSHFGATLLRHVVVTGLRYSLYHLGQPLPDKVPLRIDRLRLYFDGTALSRLLDATADGRALSRALNAPGGAAADDEEVPAGAVFFHRQRLRWARRRRIQRPVPASTDSVTALEYHFRQQLAQCLPALNDALLDEVVTVLGRRKRRQRGATLLPCLGAAAASWLSGHQTQLDRLGPPDPYVPSWAEGPPEIDASTRATNWRREGGRGRFRERYRQVLDIVRPTLVALGAAALANGVVDHQDDLFFLPFELLDDLTVDAKPAWLSAAVLRNRGEYFGLQRDVEEATREAWNAAPIEPLA